MDCHTPRVLLMSSSYMQSSKKVVQLVSSRQVKCSPVLVSHRGKFISSFWYQQSRFVTKYTFVNFVGNTQVALFSQSQSYGQRLCYVARIQFFKSGRYTLRTASKKLLQRNIIGPMIDIQPHSVPFYKYMTKVLSDPSSAVCDWALLSMPHSKSFAEQFAEDKRQTPSLQRLEHRVRSRKLKSMTACGGLMQERSSLMLWKETFAKSTWN